MILIKISDLEVNIEGLRILHNVDMYMNKGELVVVIGANGVGKSTLLRTIIGLNKCQKGKIEFNGIDITNKSTEEISISGLSLVPEGRQLFPELSARDNLLIGAYSYRDNKKSVMENLNNVFTLFPVLKKNEFRNASTFSGGEQQMLAIGRGLMSDPKLMMIDELSLGLAPLAIQSLLKVIKDLNAKGMSILLIEQNARMALKAADRAYVLENGRITINGTGEDLLKDKNVKEAYLGL